CSFAGLFSAFKVFDAATVAGLSFTAGFSLFAVTVSTFTPSVFATLLRAGSSFGATFSGFAAAASVFVATVFGAAGSFAAVVFSTLIVGKSLSASFFAGE